MFIQKISNINFGERGIAGGIITRQSLVDPKKTVYCGNEFAEDVYSYARKCAGVHDEFAINHFISQDDLAKITGIMDTTARKKEIVKTLVKNGFKNTLASVRIV